MDAPTPQELLNLFSLASICEDSLTPWASVHRATTLDGQEVVVKRTAGDRASAVAMSAWTRPLHGLGVPVVTPLILPASNPQPVTAGGEGDWWAVYPFVAGRPYTGSMEQVRTAGDLLGRIHAAPIPTDVCHGLRQYEWTEATAEDAQEDLRTLGEKFADHMGGDPSRAAEVVGALASRWWETSLPQLCEADDAGLLPRVACSSDYKASNLVWAATARPEGLPTLVDPDNGGFEPRILDLALALVLFRNECPTAPARLLTPEEWKVFSSAYQSHVTLTERERELWPAALDHMAWEEGTWVLEDNDEESWADARQGVKSRVVV